MNISLEPAKTHHSVWDDYVPIVEQGHTYQIFLQDYIEGPQEYNQLLYVLSGLESYHKVFFHINNGGGNSHTAFMLRHAILECKAETTAILSGLVASAATIITLACDKIICRPFLSFMAHNYFHGVEGTGNQVKDYVDFTDRELGRAFNEIYTNFLTPEEIALVTKRDQEIWLNEIEVMERWDTYKNAKSSKPPKGK